MSQEIDKIDLKEAAELAGKTPREILIQAAKGLLRVCIKTPKDHTVFITCDNDESISREGLRRFEEVRRFGPSPQAVQYASSLVLTHADARDV